MSQWYWPNAFQPSMLYLRNRGATARSVFCTSQLRLVGTTEAWILQQTYDLLRQASAHTTVTLLKLRPRGHVNRTCYQDPWGKKLYLSSRTFCKV